MVNIKKVHGGYILTDTRGIEHIYVDLLGVFEHLLLHYEGLASTFTGDLYGKVIIDLIEPAQ